MKRDREKQFDVLVQIAERAVDEALQAWQTAQREVERYQEALSLLTDARSRHQTGLEQRLALGMAAGAMRTIETSMRTIGTGVEQAMAQTDTAQKLATQRRQIWEQAIARRDALTKFVSRRRAAKALRRDRAEARGADESALRVSSEA